MRFAVRDFFSSDEFCPGTAFCVLCLLNLMDPRKWLITTISMMLACLALIAGFNAAVDIYGLYRPTTGRRLVPLGDERIAKYLLSARYVPENFNAILSGASI